MSAQSNMPATQSVRSRQHAVNADAWRPPLARPDNADSLLWRLSNIDERRGIVAQQQFQDDVLADLAALARDERAFAATMRTAFGDGLDVAAVEPLRQDLLDGSFAPPRLVLSDAQALGGAAGAYAAGADTVYLDESLVGTAEGRVTLMEELGHALDARLHEATPSADSSGDEGAIFATLLVEGRIDPAVLAALRAENDQGSIVVDGQRIDVEFRRVDGPGGDGPAGTGGTGESGGYSGSDYPWNPGGVAVSPPPRPPGRTQRAAITVATHFPVFDNPHGRADGRAVIEDFEELASGDYDRGAAAARLVASGVGQSEVEHTLDEIQYAAALLVEDPGMFDLLDVARESGAGDGHVSRQDAEAWMMSLSRGSTHAESLDARSRIVTRAVSEEFAPNGMPDAFDAVLVGDSHLGALSTDERLLAIDAALEVWLPHGAYDMRQPHRPEFLLTSLAQSDPALHRAAVDLYVDRAVRLTDSALASTDGQRAEPLRFEAATLAGSVFYSIIDDPEASRALFERIDEPTAVALVDALALDRRQASFENAHRGMSGQQRRIATAATIMAFGMQDQTASQHAFVRAAFTSLPADPYRNLTGENQQGFTDRIGLSIAATRHADPGVRRAEAERLGAILRTDQGQQLLAFDSDIDPVQRADALALVLEHPEWNAATFEASDSVWTNPTIMQAFARPRAEAYAELRGDAPLVLQGSALENQIGTAIGLMPDPRSPDESPAAILAREQAIAEGRASYFEDEVGAGIVGPVADQIRRAGGDPPAVTIVPLQYSSAQAGVQELVLFRVADPDDPSNASWVDATGAWFPSLENWRSENGLPPGFTVLPEDGRLLMQGGPASGVEPASVSLEAAVTHSTVDTWQEHALQWADTGAAVAGIVAGGAIVLGSGGTAAPLVAGGAALWTTGRAGERLLDRAEHRQSLALTDPAARRLWLDAGLGLVSTAGGALGATTWLRASRLANSAAPLDDLSRAMTLTSRVNRTGSVLDGASAASDSYELIANWNELDGNERAALALNIGFWGTGALAQHRIAGSTSQAAGNPDAALYDPQSLRSTWLTQHEAQWPRQKGNTDYRWSETVPPIRMGHVSEGNLRYSNVGNVSGGSPSTGFHHRPGGVDPDWHRTSNHSTPDAHGVYTADVELWDPASQSWRTKRHRSTFFPDAFSDRQIERAVLEAHASAGSPNASGIRVGASSAGFEIEFTEAIIDLDGVPTLAITAAYPVTSRPATP